jgi:DNA helicase-2/ATP-dependent DNA helicase PcrA
MVSAYTKSSGIPDDVFDKSKPVTASMPIAGTNTGGYHTVTRPKAVVKPKETRAEVKPFIAKGTAMFGAQGITKGVQTPGEKPEYEVGDRVAHIKFGQGTVKALEKGTKDYQVTVEFDEYGQKILFAAFAKLKKV